MTCKKGVDDGGGGGGETMRGGNPQTGRGLLST